jgi:hypothetical protein
MPANINRFISSPDFVLWDGTNPTIIETVARLAAD